MYGSEVWTLSKSYENTLAIWEINILRIFDPVEENGVWKIRTNQELMNMCRETNSIWEIRKGSLWRLEYVERMSEETTLEKVFKNTPERKRSVGNPRKRWLDSVENNLNMGVRGW